MASGLISNLVLQRCPHCAVSSPGLNRLWLGRTTDLDGKSIGFWAAYACNRCGSITSVRGSKSDTIERSYVSEIFPKARSAHEDIPEIPRRFLQQAYDVIHAPDAAAMTAGSAVDAMLKHLGYTEGSVYSRIEKAVNENILTKAMGEWAHEVRLGSNRPRHADDKQPHVTTEEAEQSVAFAEALGQFLFVLAAKVQRGIDSTKTISS